MMNMISVEQVVWLSWLGTLMDNEFEFKEIITEIRVYSNNEP